MALHRYQCVWTGLAGGPGLSTFHFDPDLGGGTNDDFVSECETFWTGCASIISNDLTVHGNDFVELLDVATGEVTASQPVTPFTVAGGHADEILPAATQGLVRWNTGVYIGGRRLQGHTYIPGPIEAVTNGSGGPSTGYVSGIAGLAENFRDGIGGLGVYSKTHAQFELAIAGTCWSKWAVLRGRRD